MEFNKFGNSLVEILCDFKKIGIYDENLYASEKSDEWKVEQIMKEYPY